MSSSRVVFKATDFERPLVTVDVVIFTVMVEQLCVLLVRRPEGDGEPFPARAEGHIASSRWTHATIRPGMVQPPERRAGDQR